MKDVVISFIMKDVVISFIMKDTGKWFFRYERLTQWFSFVVKEGYDRQQYVIQGAWKHDDP